MESKTPKPKAKRRWIKILLVLFAIGVGWFLWARPDEWGFRRELPWSARDIHELSETDTLLPDYFYELKAKITEDEFRLYITKFKLTPHTPTRQYSDPIELNWHSGPETWWDPAEALTNTFVWADQYGWTYAKYERGYLYLESTCH